MILQISSGQGPAECEIAVGKLFESLQAEYPDIEKLSEHRSRFSDGFKSILFSSDEDLSELDGTVLWRCQSPVRPHHGRKNWFIDVSVIDEVEKVCRDEDILFERFHSGGKGGQHVNKVETGVRLTHLPTGITVTSTAERSQRQNREDAMKKLNAILMEKERDAEGKQRNDAWRKHTQIVRGNPVRTYEGPDFVRKK